MQSTIHWCRSNAHLQHHFEGHRCHPLPPVRVPRVDHFDQKVLPWQSGRTFGLSNGRHRGCSPQRVSVRVMICVLSFTHQLPLLFCRWFKKFNFEALRSRQLTPPIVPQVQGPVDTSNFDSYPVTVDPTPPDDYTGWDEEFWDSFGHHTPTPTHTTYLPWL